MTSEIRLGCLFCDRTNHDGVSVVPEDWEDIEPIEDLYVMDWETHLGVCPDCK